MAMFFGTIQGGRGEATRLGHANTGLRTSARSYSGSIIVQLYYDEPTGVECADITVGEGSTNHGRWSLYNGPIKNLFDDKLLGRLQCQSLASS